MKISLKNYTIRYLIIAFLVIMAVWASLFYAYILDEVYDNVDDGLKNQKIEILRGVYEEPELLETSEYGINQFRIRPAEGDEEFSEENRLSREFFYMPYDDEQEPYRVLRTGFYGRDHKPYHLEIRTSTVEEDDLIYDLTTALMVLYAVLVLSLYLINTFVLGRAWRPFKIILDNLNHYRFGTKDKLRPIDTNVLEFNQLHTELDRMWRRNEELFDEQKRFIENAAHELQTPLAITINKLDLLMEDETLNESQLTQIAESKSSLLRLVNLNKSLLMLSRIENKQYKNVERVSFNDISRELVDEFQDLLDFKHIELLLHEESTFEIEMDRYLATVLISNLLRNAIKYTPEGGQINVFHVQDRFSVTNTAIGPALDPDIVFNRFHKGEQDKGSTGLGLAIVKSIVDSYPILSVGYTYANEKHMFFIKK
ncbi:HAMP domain-containing histidine kinase [Sphingobacterium psychroaquaticum]|uniref:sensor histidine kinase n=1 Tax=Sphingobacterium psychroaquaticum TaxID=561061 RepID=UPI0010691C08|nr:HAMP domain-containing sensor histidine kinase [Sphingobacterium psychroaquaticum]QBQ40596.1 HAMP domain-containing histidine kinase [Sphingobacterium psychroaquaticum]